MKLSYDDVRDLKDSNLGKLFHLYDTEIDDELGAAIKSTIVEIKNLSNLYEIKIAKPAREAAKAKEEARSLKEDLRFYVSEEEADLIESVLGQMSDGKWENNASYDKYWQNIKVDGTTVIVNTNRLKHASWTDAWDKEFTKNFTSVDSFKKWIGHKAQLVHNDDCRNSFGSNKIEGHENDKARYLDSWRNKSINQTYGQIQYTINKLCGKC